MRLTSVTLCWRRICLPGYSRLKISKLSIESLIDKLHGDHIGIVVFAGSAYKHLPITPDYHVAKTFTQNVTTRMMSAQGTDIGLAIDECMTSFNFENGANKTIVVFSDGEDHEEQGMIAARKGKRARRRGSHHWNGNHKRCPYSNI